MSDHTPAQDRTESDAGRGKAPSGVGMDRGAREALVERIAEAIKPHTSESHERAERPTGCWCKASLPDGEWSAHVARAVLPLVDAEVAAAVAHDRRQHDLANGGCVPKPAYDDLAAAVSEAQAEIAAIQFERDVACTSIQMERVAEKRRADSAEAEVERLRERLARMTEIARERGDDLAFSDAHLPQWWAIKKDRDRLREGIRALADYGVGEQWPPDEWRAAILRALLAPSPAATTGESGHDLHDVAMSGLNAIERRYGLPETPDSAVQ